MLRLSYISLAAAAASLLVGQTRGAQPPAQDVKLLFSTSQDVRDTWGKLHFGATPMQKVRNCEHPGFSLACCFGRHPCTASPARGGINAGLSEAADQQ